jgi:hypothetical protein
LIIYCADELFDMYAFITRTVHNYPIMLSRILDLYSVQEIGNTTETRTEKKVSNAML